MLEDRRGRGARVTAAELIRQLEAGGMTQREIARRINRGPSYVSKVATGRKPGGGLEASLRALERGAGSAHAPRRRTRAGTPARVRRPASAPKAAREAPRATGTLSERVREGMRPDGMGGKVRVTYPGSPDRARSVSWSVHAWRGSDGWHDLTKGDAGFKDRPGSVQYVVLDLPIGKRQFSALFTDSFDLADLVAQALEEYGLAE